MAKKRIFSGIQPSGNLHIGNYLGAIKNWVELQDNYESIFCIVDLHAITVPKEANELKKNIKELAKVYIAAGINPKKSTIFVQSDRPEHSELAWILNCYTSLGELSRMTQFKDKAGLIPGRLGSLPDTRNLSAYTREQLEFIIRDIEAEWEESDTFRNSNRRKEESVTAGLFDYPVLMAADILLYDTELVPVGEDQKQHVEFTRDIAERFNKKYGQTFVVPKPDIREAGARIMGLDDPAKKMSKTAPSEYNWISLREKPEDIRKKIAKAVTDSGNEVKFDKDKKSAVANLLTIYSLFSGKSMTEIEKMYAGKGYGDFKKDLAEVIIAGLKPIQDKLSELDKNPDYIEKILKEGAERIRPIAQKTLAEVKSKVGLG
ncbi:MAG: tryptophan--tRNA ligase [Patescibacteria group bacterium]|nr:tryptophan--tRNA ligase [Patescibacteria group bacterium]